jgi:hypothetical protein
LKSRPPKQAPHRRPSRGAGKQRAQQQLKLSAFPKAFRHEIRLVHALSQSVKYTNTNILLSLRSHFALRAPGLRLKSARSLARIETSGSTLTSILITDPLPAFLFLPRAQYIYMNIYACIFQAALNCVSQEPPLRKGNNFWTGNFSLHNLIFAGQ